MSVIIACMEWQLPTTRDFRTEAAEATLLKLRSVGGSVGDLDESGCAFVAGGRAIRYVVEVPGFAIIVVCWVLLVWAMLMVMGGSLSNQQAILVVMGSFVIA